MSLAVEAVTSAVAQILGRTTPPVRNDRLLDLGLDSLMALELKKRLQTTFGIHQLSSTLVFDYPTSEAVAKFILLQLGYQDDARDESARAYAEEVSATARVHSEEELDQMSNDDIAELLRMQLEP